ncbi:MAG: glutathione S-transferase family protein [Gammaproteobacteria bacterium]|nr:glutathione S-transferase family protein [Gammaproteobacteria bacterium]
MQLELVSFNLCPYVQRSRITLLYKNVAHRITYIDLDDRPQWFNEMSPRGKVPLLRVDADILLFESAVINEFIDEITPEPLQLADPLLRAMNRAWVEFGAWLLESQYRMVSMAKTEQECLEQRNQLYSGLQGLEAQLGEGPFFNGERFSLTDSAYAPLFTQIDAANAIKPLVDYSDLPKISRWREALLALSAVRESVIADFDSVYRDSLTASSTYYAEYARRKA